MKFKILNCGFIFIRCCFMSSSKYYSFFFVCFAKHTHMGQTNTNSNIYNTDRPVTDRPVTDRVELKHKHKKT